MAKMTDTRLIAYIGNEWPATVSRNDETGELEIVVGDLLVRLAIEKREAGVPDALNVAVYRSGNPHEVDPGDLYSLVDETSANILMDAFLGDWA